MMGPGPRNTTTPPKEQQIYMPVAHLQQKQRQRQLQQQSPEAEQYGFGLQFQQSQSQFYQQMVDAGLPMQSPPDISGQQGYGTANHAQVLIKTYDLGISGVMKIMLSCKKYRFTFSTRHDCH